MKKYILKIKLLIILGFVSTFSFSQKIETKEVLTTKLTKENIMAFINKTNKAKKPFRTNFIKELETNMQFDKMYIERSQIDVQVIVIPLKKNYFSQYAKNSIYKPIQYVLIFEREKQLISRADFLLFFPTDKKITSLPKNAFHDFYYQEQTQIDGTFTLVNFGDVKQIEMNILNGKRIGDRTWMHKDNFNATGDNDCREWELITTTYNIDGIKEEKQPLGKTCTECPPGVECDKIKK